MELTYGEKGVEITFQGNFPKTTKCCRCGGECRIAFVIADDGEIRDLHPNEGKGGFWLHDACAVAVYFCRDCLEPTALYNQA